ncbi:hypothetical protein P3339_03370 [Microbulbifer sp. MLAF003]|uniref:hypothetical protein n=1 Tax=Microbulbifer sp. MLAF003 TaxID=3032582 RepID=UPI0024AE80C1|nr:hypothetical protein [Microbulbifer sp. MLAF003]WHI51884.1 hypothetical protein P3339_03370 [Microbulbifer sp. MLAF003]
MRLKPVLLLLLLPAFLSAGAEAEVSSLAQDTADYAVEKYEGAMTKTLASLVRFETVASEEPPWLITPLL